MAKIKVDPQTGQTLSQGNKTKSQTKTCNKCGKEKLLGEFNRQGGRHHCYRTECKQCQGEWRKQYYAAHGAKQRLHQKTQVEQWLEFISKDEIKCQVCGYNDCWAAIEFHHRNPAEKEYTIGRLMLNAFNAKNQSILTAELDKCDILCCRCHRELHWYEKHPEEVCND